MQLEVKINQVLLQRKGEGKNGPFSFTPFVIVFEEPTPNGVNTHEFCVELSDKVYKTEELKKLVGTGQKITFYFYFSTREYQGRKFNEVSAFPADSSYRLPRENQQ